MWISKSLQLIRRGHNLTGSIYFPGNEIEIFTEGKSKFDALKNDLERAERSIYIQYYIFEEDNIGREISEILIRKSLSGVKVRIIYDHVGCFQVSKSFYRRMSEAGIEVHPFFKVTFPEFATRVNWRNHRKIGVIDAKVGYIGGMNIADRYINGVDGSTWRDTHLRIVGQSEAGLL